MKYRNCVFDLYGTLVDIHTREEDPRVWERTAGCYAALGARYAPEELREAYSRQVALAQRGAAAPLRRDAHEGYPEIRIEEVFQALFRARGADPTPEEIEKTALTFRRESTEYIRLYDGVEDALRTLRKSGRGVWLLSNAQGCFTRMELEELGLTPLFDGILLSSDHGCKKPDRRFFDLLLRRCSIPPHTAVMVGNDGVCDILGARQAGLSTLYIRSNLSPEEPAPPADYALDGVDMAAVLDILLQ